MRTIRLLSLLLLAGAAFAARPLQPPAPEFPAQSVWVNARDLSLKRLRGRRVVLVAFINTMNINSLRAISALEEWDRRYSLEGLMVIGVHTPEFGFQKDPAAMKSALRRAGAGFPVVLDNDRVIWKAYTNDGWPAFYLIDPKGRIVFDRLGENGYQELEAMMQAELEKLTGSAPSGGEPSVPDPPPVGGECGEMTAELNLGLQRNTVIDMDKDGLPDRSILTTGRDGEVSTRGRWGHDPENLRLNQQNADLSAYVRVIYRGAQGFAILGPGSGPTKFWLRQDDLWLDSSNAGKDVRFDGERRAFVLVDFPRAYELTRNPNDNLHDLLVTPLRIGGRVYGFSFTNECLKIK
ncbi:MAG: redoxin domain-containing protein [Elusimicrobia bacterium]|nr:redoxin domain-containing protein [Elusimicrobiota bacterium]